ncbi:MAG: hypothetical protein JWP63_994 [Candidatus Solibacter sp.]|jgi:hypothetical protein|nr:hypothetical protein [Candidatus Solibacter sp.]
MAAVDTDTTLEELIAGIQRPVVRQQKRSRALQPFSEPDVDLLEAIGRGDFLIQGVRNGDLPNSTGALPRANRNTGSGRPPSAEGSGSCVYTD